jgi:hypothetical protein
MDLGRYLLVNLWSVALARSMRSLFLRTETFSFSVGSFSGSSSSSSEWASISAVEGSGGKAPNSDSTGLRRVPLSAPPLAFGVGFFLLRFSEARGGVLSWSGFRAGAAC